MRSGLAQWPPCLGCPWPRTRCRTLIRPEHPWPGVGGASADPSLHGSVFSCYQLQWVLLKLASDGQVLCLDSAGKSSLVQWISQVSTLCPGSLRAFSHTFSGGWGEGRDQGSENCIQNLSWGPSAEANTFRPRTLLFLVNRTLRVHETSDVENPVFF